MKAKRRHELQTNTLADWLGSRLELVKPYWKTIAAVAVVIFALGFISLLRTGTLTGLYLSSFWGSGNKSTGWLELYTTLTGQADTTERRDTLERLADEHEGQPVGNWARLWLADQEVETGLQAFYLDREKAQKSLRTARDEYKQVVQASDKQPILKQRALFGLGRAYESLGELDEARQSYAELVELAGDSAYGKAASNRLDYLVDAETGKLRPELVALVAEIESHDWAPPLPDRTTPEFGSGFDNPDLDIGLDDLLRGPTGGSQGVPKAPGANDNSSPLERLFPEENPGAVTPGETTPGETTPSPRFPGETPSPPSTSDDLPLLPDDTSNRDSDTSPSTPSAPIPDKASETDSTPPPEGDTDESAPSSDEKTSSDQASDADSSP